MRCHPDVAPAKDTFRFLASMSHPLPVQNSAQRDPSVALFPKQYASPEVAAPLTLNQPSSVNGPGDPLAGKLVNGPPLMNAAATLEPVARSAAPPTTPTMASTGNRDPETSFMTIGFAPVESVSGTATDHCPLVSCM